jgi:hypothetical protein
LHADYFWTALEREDGTYVGRVTFDPDVDEATFSVGGRTVSVSKSGGEQGCLFRAYP